MTICKIAHPCPPILGLPILACLSTVVLSSCAATSDRWASQLPEVNADNAVTLMGRSNLNVSDIQHEHLLMVDGILAGRFKQDQAKTFQIPAGSHVLSLTCHTSVITRNAEQQFNYNVPAGKARLEIDPKPGDEICIKIDYALTNCAVIKDADPSYCRRTDL